MALTFVHMAAFKGFGAAMKSIREAAGIRSQADWAARAGVAPGTVNKMETGARLPDCETVERLLDAVSANAYDLAAALAKAQGTPERLAERAGQPHADDAAVAAKDAEIERLRAELDESARALRRAVLGTGMISVGREEG